MTATTIRVQMAQRKDTAANWTAANPILLSGEIGYETDTKKFKIGNGSTNWNSLAYLPIPDGSGNLTITGNLEIGSTGSLTFEGSTADGFETTLAVTNPTADRTITLPNQSGNVLVSGNASIIDADIAANAEIAVSKLADGTARQLLQTDAAGTGVEWTSNVDIPGTLDVTGAATFDAAVTVAGDLTVNGTTTTISTQNLLVEDKNIIIGDVASPTDVTADGGGITLKGATDKTINWVDATDAWTSSERFSVPLGTAALPSLTFTGDPNTGIYSPGADQVAISTNGTKRIEIQADGDIDIDNGGVFYDATNNRLAIGTTSPGYALDTRGAIASTSASGIQTVLSFASDGIVGTVSNHSLTFFANNGERARIDTSGRLLVGTSSTSSASALVVQNNSSGNGVGVVRINYSTDSPGANDTLGIVSFGDNTHGEYTSVAGLRDGGTWSSTSKPTRLTFSTTADGASSPTERMRIRNTGQVWINQTANGYGVSDTTILQVTAGGSDYVSSFYNTNASPYGLFVRHDTDSNNTSNLFIQLTGGTTTRAQIRSNGGLANYQANDVNLSDINTKKDISPAADTWDCIKEWEIVNYRYKDQPDDADLNLGVIAQQVAESCPEVITVFEEAKDDQPEKLGVKEQQMYWMAIKALQEAQVRIETLEAEVAALKAR